MTTVVLVFKTLVNASRVTVVAPHAHRVSSDPDCHCHWLRAAAARIEPFVQAQSRLNLMSGMIIQGLPQCCNPV
eukprot:963259-Rhodomonas_salina.2